MAALLLFDYAQPVIIRARATGPNEFFKYFLKKYKNRGIMPLFLLE